MRTERDKDSNMQKLSGPFPSKKYMQTHTNAHKQHSACNACRIFVPSSEEKPEDNAGIPPLKQVNSKSKAAPNLP